MSGAPAGSQKSTLLSSWLGCSVKRYINNDALLCPSEKANPWWPGNSCRAKQSAPAELAALLPQAAACQDRLCRGILTAQQLSYSTPEMLLQDCVTSPLLSVKECSRSPTCSKSKAGICVMLAATHQASQRYSLSWAL